MSDVTRSHSIGPGREHERGDRSGRRELHGSVSMDRAPTASGSTSRPQIRLVTRGSPVAPSVVNGNRKSTAFPSGHVGLAISFSFPVGELSMVTEERLPNTVLWNT